MSDKYRGIPAFPNHTTDGCDGDAGMTLRDYFAAKQAPPEIHISLAEMLAGPAPKLISIEYVKWVAEWQAKWKYIHADAMLKAREL